ncbi:MAG: ABC transporter ATP-binding protein [Gammaproteobacteria bacterium]|jgi:ABC-2 type transport system ATP-binding protein|nr:ABC transporter ATP-binding protein [Gammaproteobacteria bacterium]MDP6731172.1 ABC transporter ATP-binding protein [Gammaproteobacteria bacterium]|tara:strand:- start:3790 stop:4728 length:939 start_codon:yes stop_codon:yes gene_type:complete
MDATAEPILTVTDLNKTYSDGFQALKNINLEIQKGEIIALLGPNGAGKTTLISTICGIVRPSSGAVTVAGYDIIRDFRKTRSLIGLVPQELTTDSFESVLNTLTFSRGLFGKAPDAGHLERVLKALSLWEKKDNMILTLSGGMKRRVLIAKALAHEPSILFLDEPTAGVDVTLRKDMWKIVNELRDEEVTIILTTHYIEEAEEIADRIGVINKGELILVEEKTKLMRKLGKKQLHLDLSETVEHIPASLSAYDLELSAEGDQLIYTFDTRGEHTGITALLDDLKLANIRFRDLNTTQSSLEEIFVNLVKESN